MSVRAFSWLSLVLFLAGCAVLNSDQVAEVQRFANATRDYGTLPGSVLLAYANVRTTNNVLQLENVRYGDAAKAQAAWGLLDENTRETTKFLDSSAKIDDALRILDDYSAQLSALSSDDYTQQIEQSATNLGQSIDGAVATYNTQYAASMASPGAAAAAVVRGLGDWYVKVQQARLLKQRVLAADPLVQTLTTHIETGLAPFALQHSSEGEANLMLNEREQLGSLFKVAGSRRDLTPDFVARVASADAQIDTASALAVSAMGSARRYREAHARLVAAMTDPGALSQAHNDIAALRAEVDATRRFEQRLKDQQR
jgi:hypothetical protein